MSPDDLDVFAPKQPPSRSSSSYDDSVTLGPLPHPGFRPHDPAETPMPGLPTTPKAVAAETRNLNEAITGSGLNLVVAQANPLLALVPHIRQLTHADPLKVKQELVAGVEAFKKRAQQKGLTEQDTQGASFVLCTLLDEVASETPWGGLGAWGRHSLLAMFHQQTDGGTKVFELLAKMGEDTQRHHHLMELIYVALCLGFKGKFAVQAGGSAQLESVRERLATLLKELRGDHAQPLAEHWRGQAFKRRSALTWLPLWVTGSVAGALLLGLFWLLSSWLAGLSEPTYGQIQSLRLLPPTPTVTQPAPTPRLAQFLANEIRAGLVAVRDDLDRSVITIRGDGLFEPASASLSADREALMQRMAEALSKVQGQILVTGHTDNQPINSLRFPSNWHLSEERARAVQVILVSRGVQTRRVSAEGRADGEPVVANDTPANRARNRRVEVTLMAAPSAPSGHANNGANNDANNGSRN
jgi:type VI secretion system protein ImpK